MAYIGVQAGKQGMAYGIWRVWQRVKVARYVGILLAGM